MPTASRHEQLPEPGARSTRGASQVASLPLALIALTFFLPFVDQCGNGTMLSPVGYLRAGEDAIHGLWLLPPFVGAALLAVFTWLGALGGAVSGGDGAPGRLLRIGALLVLGAGLCADLLWVVTGLPEGSSWERRFGVWSLGAVTLGALLFASARRWTGWSAWLRWIGVHALLSSPLCWVVVSVAKRDHVGVGGHLYVACDAALLLIVAITVASQWRTSGTSAAASPT